MIDPLSPDSLRQSCDPDQFDFKTTSDLAADTRVVGQDRAVEALDFGVTMQSDGYNVFALGPAGSGRRKLVEHVLKERSADEETPPDWCYVDNFDESREPRALQLPAGKGRELEADVDTLIEDAKSTLPATFESEEYQSRREMAEQEVRQDQEDALEALQDRARQEDVALIQTPQGFAFAPIHNGDVLSPDEVETMPPEEREAFQEKLERFQEQLQSILRYEPEHQREARQRIEKLNKEMGREALANLFEVLKDTYREHEAVCTFLDEMLDDIVEHIDQFIQPQQQNGGGQEAMLAQLMQQGGGNAGGSMPGGDPWRRYRVNCIVDHSDTEGAPVVFEDNPNYQNLVGQLEKIAQMGALITDFNLIQPGALHEANGGYLVIEARKLLMQPYVWEGLKRALQSGEIQIESPHEALGLMQTVTLEPEAIPLDVKIVLVGEPLLYYLLSELDPDVDDLFKVMADFDDRIDRTGEHEASYADLIATIAAEHDLQPFDASAVARVIDRSVRLVGDTEKLSGLTERIGDLVHEASHFAVQDAGGEATVTADHVQTAIDHQIRRADRVRERIQESIERDTIYIDTDGEATGQVNGLAVLQLGGFSFGKPNRITARTRLGSGEIVDIEREADLGGATHSKGVLILSGFLQGRYAQDTPLSLSASLVFEQSYGGVDGDSASSAELYALLSSLSDLPLRQDLAVTGSVNQHGVVQPIGGVNEKVEGFYDVCESRGLTGSQGVLIPADNAKNLMLRPDVAEAAAQGRFHVYPVETIDQGIEMLTGVEASERKDGDGPFPDDSINGRVEARLRDLAERRREFAMNGETGGE